MRDSSYSALFGALSNEMRMSSIANNLANVNTTAYKTDKLAFHDAFIRFAHDYVVDERSYLRADKLFPDAQVMAKPRLSDQQIDFTQGSLQKTGNQLDFALAGNGFFSIDVGGETLFTRAGNFLVDANGRVCTQDGNTVLVEGGPLLIPPGAKVMVGGNGTIAVNGEITGSFDVVTFDDLTKLERVGDNNYRAKEGAAPIPAQDVTVEQGFLERGNVEVVTEMVSMIETQRAFTMYTKMIKASDETDKKLITQVGRPTI